MAKAAVRPRRTACPRIFCLRSLMALGESFNKPFESMVKVILYLLSSRRGRGVGEGLAVGVGIDVGMTRGFTPTVLAERKMTARASSRSAKSHPLISTVSLIPNLLSR